MAQEVYEEFIALRFQVSSLNITDHLCCISHLITDEAVSLSLGSNGSGRSWTEYLESNYARMPVTALRPLIKVVDNKDSIEIFICRVRQW